MHTASNCICNFCWSLCLWIIFHCLHLGLSDYRLPPNPLAGHKILWKWTFFWEHILFSNALIEKTWVPAGTIMSWGQILQIHREQRRVDHGSEGPDRTGQLPGDQCTRGFHSHGSSPIAGWFFLWNMKMDDEQEYYFRKPPCDLTFWLQHTSNIK